MRLLLLGYYGFHNLGDDIMAEGLIKTLTEFKEITELAIVTNEKYYRSSLKCKQLKNPKGYLEWLKLLSKYDVIMWGGGTCLFESDGLKWLAIIIFISRIMNRKFLFAGIGVEYPNKLIPRTLITFMLKFSEYICVRDDLSFFLCREKYGISASKMNKIEDLAYLGLHNVNINECPKKLNNISNISFSGHFQFITPECIHHYANILTNLLNVFKNAKLHFLPAHDGNRSDNEQHKLIMQNIPELFHDRIIIHSNINSDLFEEIIIKMDFHIGFRLHSLFLAEVYNIPYIAINYAPKVSSFVKYMNRTGVNVMEYLSSETIVSIISGWAATSTNIRQLQLSIRKTLKKVLFSVL